jgi:hypothetical protein
MTHEAQERCKRIGRGVPKACGSPVSGLYPVPRTVSRLGVKRFNEHNRRVIRRRVVPLMLIVGDDPDRLAVVLHVSFGAEERGLQMADRRRSRTAAFQVRNAKGPGRSSGSFRANRWAGMGRVHPVTRGCIRMAIFKGCYAAPNSAGDGSCADPLPPFGPAARMTATPPRKPTSVLTPSRYCRPGADDVHPKYSGHPNSAKRPVSC